MIRNILCYAEESARRFPGKTAFADEETACTYDELIKSARAVGTRLGREVTPGKPVPVLMEKGVKAIYAFMGIVSAGCFYILLDPKLPTERLRSVLDTLQAEVLLTDPAYDKPRERLEFDGKVIMMEEALQTQEDAEYLDNVRKQSRDVDPLYAIFTSGSTGVPKGVVVSHRSVIDFIEEFTRLFNITEHDVIGNQAPFDFDVSVKDIYSTLKCGATMQIIPKKFFSFPTKLLDYLVEREVTILIWAVSALCIISTLKGFDYKVPQKIRKVIFSGEVMPVKHLNIWKKYLPEAMYVNVYGPTEITCNCTYHIIDREYEPGENLPIGKPFPNEKVFLLGEEDREVTKPGEKGEICVSGTALSLGYYNTPEQTAKAFVQNPLNQSYLEPIYRTGDLAYYGEDGNLYFASRKDFQIKHMGHRIELEEIERSMTALDGVEKSCCIFDTEKNRIMGFYLGEKAASDVRKQMKEKLPVYMVPTKLIQVDEMPLNKNGKTDRNYFKNYGKK